MGLSTITSKGQLTVPKNIRDFLKIETGDKVEFIIDEEGHVILSPKTLRVDDICGMFTKRKGITIEDMNNAIAHYMKGKGEESSERH